MRYLLWRALIHMQTDIREGLAKRLYDRWQSIPSLGMRGRNTQRALGLIGALLSHLFNRLSLS